MNLTLESNPALTDLLYRWLPEQRWYPARGKGVSLRDAGLIRLPGSGARAQLAVHLVAVDSGDRLDVVQVPLSWRAPGDELAGIESIGRLTDAGEEWVIYDGAHDPAVVGAYLDAITGSDLANDADPAADPGTLVGHTTGLWSSTRGAGELPSSRVLSGEQSNTSIIVTDELPAIIKLFRVLGSGMNPDVEVGIGLTEANCPAVAQTYGWVDGSWSDRSGAGSDDEAQSGQLAVLSEFMAGSEDAWRTATVAAIGNSDFTAAARALGEATARVHESLRDAFGSEPAEQSQRSELTDGIARRIRWAWDEAAESVGEYGDEIDAAIGRLSTSTQSVSLQRIHGDYHLGQVLDSPQRGWIVLDFEGEPLRSVAERSLPDVAVRDVVGMLRSIDYAGGFAAQQGADPDAAALWVAAASDAFVEGYEQRSGARIDRRDPIFVALWLDKALYEVVYELRNRPDWLSVPVAAVRRVLGNPENTVGTPNDHNDSKPETDASSSRRTD